MTPTPDDNPIIDAAWAAYNAAIITAHDRQEAEFAAVVKAARMEREAAIAAAAKATPTPPPDPTTPDRCWLINGVLCQGVQVDSHLKRLGITLSPEEIAWIDQAPANCTALIGRNGFVRVRSPQA